jgi:protein-tyrosine phosphatase
MTWVWTLNWGEIRRDMVIGSCPMTTEDIDRIRKQTRVTAVLSLQTDECRATFGIDYKAHQRHGERQSLVMANAPMRDFDPLDQRMRLPDAVRILHDLLATDHRVYVHCTAGINRAPLTVLAYLTFVGRMNTDEAMELIHCGRPNAEPYWEAYQGCWHDLVTQNRGTIKRRAWELSQLNPENAAGTHWQQAEKEVIYGLFIATQWSPTDT